MATSGVKRSHAGAEGAARAENTALQKIKNGGADRIRTGE